MARFSYEGKDERRERMKNAKVKREGKWLEVGKKAVGE